MLHGPAIDYEQEGEHVKCYPNRKKGGGAENVLAMLKRVHKKMGAQNVSV